MHAVLLHISTFMHLSFCLCFSCSHIFPVQNAAVCLHSLLDCSIPHYLSRTTNTKLPTDSSDYTPSAKPFLFLPTFVRLDRILSLKKYSKLFTFAKKYIHRSCFVVEARAHWTPPSSSYEHAMPVYAFKIYIIIKYYFVYHPIGQTQSLFPFPHIRQPTSMHWKCKFQQERNLEI